MLRLALALVTLTAAACRERAPEPVPPPPPSSAAPAPPADPGAATIPSREELIARVDALKDRIKDRPKTLEILVALGDLYYGSGRYADAADWYGQAVALAARGFERLDALPSSARAAAPSARAQAACDRDREKRSYDELARAADGFVRARAAGDAAYCWRQALAPALDARARRGSALLFLERTDEALREEDAVLARDPAHADALFFTGVALAGTARGDRGKLARARDAWRRLAAAHPDDPRAARAREGASNIEALLAANGEGRGGGKREEGEGVGEGRGQGARAGAGQGLGTAMPPMDAKFWATAEGQVREGEALLAKGDLAGARQRLEKLVAVVVLQEREAPARLAARVLAAMGYVYAGLGQRDRSEPMLRMALERDPANSVARQAVAALEGRRDLPPFQPPASSSP